MVQFCMIKLNYTAPPEKQIVRIGFSDGVVRDYVPLPVEEKEQAKMYFAMIVGIGLVRFNDLIKDLYQIKIRRERSEVLVKDVISLFNESSRQEGFVAVCEASGMIGRAEAVRLYKMRNDIVHAFPYATVMKDMREFRGLEPIEEYMQFRMIYRKDDGGCKGEEEGKRKDAAGEGKGRGESGGSAMRNGCGGGVAKFVYRKKIDIVFVREFNRLIDGYINKCLKYGESVSW